MFSLPNVISKEELSTFCRKNHITKLSLFGSALRDELRPNSDIDILVEFEENHIPGLITFCGMQNELSDIIEKEVDLRTPQDLSRYFRDEVVETASVQYVQE
ncbi:MAG: nucleotidyltransferase family protein [Nitrospira sp.]|nr:nucleotidyltransferase family protein [Candidatus Brocadiales bacterium]MBL7050474.1 nucleotidyltransferase family protein [Nitrospira sp.]